MSNPRPNQWAKDLITRLDDGMWWHIPSTDTVLRIDKKRNRFVLIKGNMHDVKHIKTALSEIRYHIISRDDEDNL